MVGAVGSFAAVLLILQALGLSTYSQRAEEAFTLDRLWEQAGGSFADWFTATPWQGWGLGTMSGGGPQRLARLGEATSASRYAELQAAYKPTTILEGNIPYLLLGGGIVWLALHIAAAALVLRRRVPMARQVFLGMAIWGLNHNVICTAYAFVFGLLLSETAIGEPARKSSLVANELRGAARNMDQRDSSDAKDTESLADVYQ